LCSQDFAVAPDILSSPEIQAFASGFPVLILHVLVTFGLLGLGATVYAWLTPWKEIRLIREGNAAAAVAFGGVLLGLAIPLAVSLSVSTSARDILVWGAATLVIQLLAFRVVDVILTGLPQRIQDGEISASVLLVAAKLATALILAAALAG
jgi:putative membrane protein